MNEDYHQIAQCSLNDNIHQLTDQGFQA